MKSFMARRLVLAAILLGGIAVVGGALAGQALTHKSKAASDVINACVKKEGQIYIVGSAGDCKKNESPLSWSIQGPPGAPGVSVTTAPLAAGNAHCPAGGLQVTAASGVSYVCNGAAGANGKDGANGVSVTTTSLAAGDANCPTGGVKVTSSSGDTFVCNGAKGETGATGATGPQGPQGEPGSGGTATLSSPNGVFKVEITDQGIFLRGPSKTFFLNRYSSGVGPTTSR